jgi:hypothetical protein
MPRDPDRPEPTVPLEVLRDLVAIARALYRVETDPVRLQELVEVGKGLREAIQFAKLGANTLGGRAAPANAAKYTARLCALVDAATPLEPALRAVAEKLRR